VDLQLGINIARLTQSGTHMAKKLKATTLENQYGRPIWEDVESGKRHSELSTTFKYKGKWVNMPTLHNGKIYTADELIRLLKINDFALDGGITSTHNSKSEAEQAAKSRSDSMKQTTAKTANATNFLSDEGMTLISNDPGYINRDAIKAKNDKILADKRNKKLAATVKPVFTYKGDVLPKEPINLIKNVKPDYGPVPGFKRPLDNKGNKQGYYDADEQSEFWKTDAGYEKAMQTWGKDGGVLPQFVKKPVKKELDINAIKKFFSLNR
jgi:hypothetical protein